MIATLRSSFTALVLLVSATPATAQWTRVTDLPVTDVFPVWVNGDTIAAGTDTVAYVSTDAGATWKRSAKVVAGVTSVQSVRLHRGRLYAGTFGQGMFVSDDLGDTWQAFSQGLAGGADLFIADLLVRGDSLFAATGGAGVYVRDLATPGSWSHFGELFEPNQASNVNAIAAGGTRLLASAGSNGTVFIRDPGQPDWTLSWLNNVGLAPGLGAITAIWTGSRWVVGANAGVFRSELGQSPWTFSGVGPGTLFNASFALRGADLLACFVRIASSTIAHSRDDGATWQVVETLPGVFTYNIATHGNLLYAARSDGLWRRSIANVSVPGGPEPVRLRFAIMGPHPVRGDVGLRFDLPEAGPAVIEVFDVFGRRAVDRLEGMWSAGPHEVALSARGLAPGVYLARLTAANRSEVVRLVHVR